MPRDTFQIDCDDAEAERELGQIADRMSGEHMAAAWGNVLTTLEDGERAHFGRMKGRYVRTGAVKSSLTERMAPGALRRLHLGDGVDFGSTVFYARFLTKSPYDVEDGQARKRRGQSAVLNLTPKTKRTVADQILGAIVAPAEGPHGGWAPGLKIGKVRGR